MSDLAIVLLLLVSAIVMFALGRPRMDAVALVMIVALPLTGVIDVGDALAGFADPNIVLIGALFVVGEALVRTGIAQRLGDWLVRKAGRSEARLIVLLMVVVAGIGSFMSSTGVVAIFIPIVLRIARNASIPAGRLMMPLSVAALLSGMMTLVATAPNLVVHGELMRNGLEGFGFFAFTPFGLPLLALAILYMLVAKKFLGRSAAPSDVLERPTLGHFVTAYGLDGREHRFSVRPGSPLVGNSLSAFDLRGSVGINIIAIERATRFGRQLLRPRAESRIEAGDVMLIDAKSPELDMDEVAARYGLDRLALGNIYFGDRSQEIGLAELLVSPDSRLVGKTVVDARLRSATDLVAIGIRRGREAIGGPLTEVVFHAGDPILVIGPWRAITRVPQGPERLILLNTPVEIEDVAPASHRAPHAALILLVTVALMASGVVPNVIAALLGCLMFGFFGCIDMNAAYRSIHWQTLILIVGMLPFSIALQRTGGIDIVADWLLAILGGSSPRVVLATLFALTAVLGLFISNTATAVLMAPVALALAGALNVSPYPLAMTVALAASAAFMTPVSSPVNTLVVGPGNYRFFDFVMIGVPFTLVALAVTILLVPVLLPF
ncbi:TRAP transporter large permease subunit [Mesorhizobium microcysteis]|uniref:TRAP transporter large permease subunit n=1 Tax=Neoaquamicrobium microcysteis TaxID=2682781 RepID=A0A5D4H362_9HYPH|nr:SLC13 family permease [Mesorhizobium microcysteis]TYR35481.1 TRAP transporter large permease subunit [Mesorhizobium microcysteis]